VTDIISSAVRDLGNRVFALIVRIVADREEARDLTQEVFVRTLGTHERLRDRAKLTPFILRSAVNAALNAKRDRNRRQEIHDQLRQATPAAGDTPDIALETAQIRTMLDRALGSLAEKQKQALTLRFYGKLSIAEIAAVMKISQGSVKVHLARGLQNLKAQLAPIWSEQES